MICKTYFKFTKFRFDKNSKNNLRLYLTINKIGISDCFFKHLSIDIIGKIKILIKRIHYVSLFICHLSIKEQRGLNPIQFTTLITDIKRSSLLISFALSHSCVYISLSVI